MLISNLCSTYCSNMAPGIWLIVRSRICVCMFLASPDYNYVERAWHWCRWACKISRNNVAEKPGYADITSLDQRSF